MARNATAAKKKTIRVDFSGVETSSVVPEGEYIAEVASVKMEESSAGNDYLAWELKISDGKYAGKTLYHNTSLQSQSLWATKRFLECTGQDVPDGEFDIDPEELSGCQVGVVIEHEVYKGRTRSRIVDSFPAEGDTGGKDDDDDKPAKGGKKKPAANDDDELPSDEDVEGMGKAELRKLVDEHDLEVELTGTTSAMRRAVIKALAAKRDEPEEKPAKGGKKKSADDDDDKPARGRRSKKEPEKVKASEIEEADEDDLEKLIEEHELPVKLDKLPNLRKKRAAVMDALEEKELLDEEA